MVPNQNKDTTMSRIIYHLRLVLAMKRDHGQMPAIIIIPATHTATRTRASESGGAWFVEWSE